MIEINKNNISFNYINKINYQEIIEDINKEKTKYSIIKKDKEFFDEYFLGKKITIKLYLNSKREVVYNKKDGLKFIDIQFKFLKRTFIIQYLNDELSEEELISLLKELIKRIINNKIIKIKQLLLLDGLSMNLLKENIFLVYLIRSVDLVNFFYETTYPIGQIDKFLPQILEYLKVNKILIGKVVIPTNLLTIEELNNHKIQNYEIQLFNEIKYKLLNKSEMHKNYRFNIIIFGLYFNLFSDAELKQLLSENKTKFLNSDFSSELKKIKEKSNIKYIHNYIFTVNHIYIKSITNYKQDKIKYLKKIMKYFLNDDIIEIVSNPNCKEELLSLVKKDLIKHIDVLSELYSISKEELSEKIKYNLKNVEY